MPKLLYANVTPPNEVANSKIQIPVVGDRFNLVIEIIFPSLWSCIRDVGTTASLPLFIEHCDGKSGSTCNAKKEEDEKAEDGKKRTLSLHRNLSYNNLLKAEIVKSLSITRFTRVHGLFNERNFMFPNTQLFRRWKCLCECRRHDRNGWRSKRNPTIFQQVTRTHSEILFLIL